MFLGTKIHKKQQVRRGLEYKNGKKDAISV